MTSPRPPRARPAPPRLAPGLVALLSVACAGVAPAPRAEARAGAHRDRERAQVVGHHEVQAGDTASSIARRYGVSVEQLRRANRLEDASRLYVGRVLAIPAAEGEVRPSPPARLAVRPASVESAVDDGAAARADRAPRPPRREVPGATREATTSTRTRAEVATSTPTGAGGRPRATAGRASADPSERLTAIEAEVSPPRPAPPEGCEGLQRSPRVSDRRFIWPVEGVVISAFGQREGLPHEGIDIAAPIGTPVWAGKDGTVLYSGEQPGYGRIVILGHEDGVVSIYAHNAKNCVADGAKVSQGEVIARVGDSGKATSPSLHFEVRLGAKTVNPRAHLVD